MRRGVTSPTSNRHIVTTSLEAISRFLQSARVPRLASVPWSRHRGRARSCLSLARSFLDKRILAS
jgi:hypothetical protein